MPANEVSVYPQSGQGGLLRVLGRNPKRHGSLEVAFSLNGEPGLSHLRPLKRAAVTRIVALLRGSLAPWVQRILNEPWRRSEGTARHFRQMVALGREAIRIYGSIKGHSVFWSWIDKVNANSPELSLPSLKTRDLRNVLEHGRLRAWDWARQYPTSWEPLDLQSRKDVPPGVARQYAGFVSFVRDNGLRPECFGIDYQRAALAALDGSSKSTAHRRVHRADKIGVMIILDPGLPREQGLNGECVLIGLVCRGQTPEQVRAAVAASDLVRERMECRAQRAAKLASRGRQAARSIMGKVILFPEPCVPLRPSAGALRDDMLRGPVGQYILGIAGSQVSPS